MATRYLLITPRPPFPLGSDTGDRPRVAFNAQVDKEPSTAPATTLDELTAFIVAAGIGVTTDMVMTGSMRSTPNLAVGLNEYPGVPDERGFGLVGSKYEHPMIQVVVRGEVNGYAAARALLEKIRRLFMTVEAQTL